MTTATALPLDKTGEQFQDFPAECFRIAGTVEFGDNGDDAKTIPIRLVARSADPISHWYWGSIVHNLEGAFLRDGRPVLESSERINLDFGHRDDMVIGWANKFAITDEGLVVSGALVPMPADFQGPDMAREVIYKSRQGVPYEASINFGGSGLQLRMLDEGEVRTVNGREFSGPGIVVEKWPLRNVAIVSLGADGATKSELLADGGDKITVEVLKSERNDDMASATTEENNGSDNEVAVAVELSPDTNTAEATTLVAVDAESSDTPGLRYIEAFGEIPGAVFFTKGLTFEQSCLEHIQDQATEIEDLKNQLAVSKVSSEGAEDACSFNDGDVTPKPTFSDLSRMKARKQ